MSAGDQALLDSMRKAVNEAESNLFEQVAEFCGGGTERHKVSQHRDRLPPWCNYCGRTNRGELVGGSPADTTRDLPPSDRRG